MQIKGYSRTASLTWLLLALTGIQQVRAQMFTFPLGFFDGGFPIENIDEKYFDRLLGSVTTEIKSKIVEISRSAYEIKDFQLQNFAFDVFRVPIVASFGCVFGSAFYMHYTGKFTVWNFGVTAITTATIAVLPTHYKEKITYTMSIIEKFGKPYLDKIWSFMTFEKHEEDVTASPPPLSPLRKMMKKYFPGLDKNNSTFNLLETLRNILESPSPVGLKLSSIIYGSMCATFFSFLVKTICSSTEDDIENEEWTEEQLLEEYEEDEEFVGMLDEWLTPKRQAEHGYENNGLFIELEE